MSESYALYHKPYCPYCRKVISAMKAMHINIELRDVEKKAAFNKELFQKGGKKQVPCLKITKKKQQSWMYESADIIDHLHKMADL
ncbi:MAG: glutathione S-transferase N-terminal domain-containing protein [Oceanospirillaceae bacterium]